MRFGRVYVDGFGIFRDLTVEEIPAGLSVVYGHNEAGKSTFLAFLRAILFGFADGRSQDQYPPLNGGTQGGALSLLGREGDEYLVERRAGRRGGRVVVTLPGGGRGGEEELRALLGYAGRDLYRNVFAFGLDELQRFGSLSDERVKGAIYSAGLGLGRKSLPEIEGAWGERMKESFSTARTGKNQVSRLLDQLREVRDRREALPHWVQEYDRLRQEIDRLEAERKSIEERLGQAEAEERSAERLLLAWKPWIALVAAERRLAELPPIESFPARGLERLEALEERLAEEEDALRGATDRRSRREEERAAIVVDEAALALADEIAGLERGRERYEADEAALKSLSGQLEAQARRVADGLRELGPEWTVDRLRALDLSIPNQEAVREWRRRLEAAALALRDDEGGEALAAKAVAEADRAVEEAVRALRAVDVPPGVDQASTEARRSALREMAGLLRQRRQEEERLAHLAERRDDLAAAGARAREQMAGIPGELPVWPLVALVAVGLALGGGAHLALGEGLPAIALAALWGAGLAGAYEVARRRWRDRAEGERRAAGDHLGLVEAQAGELDARKAEAEEARRRLDELLARAASSLGLSAPPDEREMEALLDETETRLERLRRRADRKEGVRREVERRRLARRERGARSERLRRAAGEARRAEAEWQGWLRTAGLRDDLSPDGALAVMDRARDCREQLSREEDSRRSLAEATERVRQYGDRAHRCAGADDGTPVGVTVDRLVARLKVARETARRREELDRELAELAEAIAQQQTRCDTLADHLAVLLAEGGAADPGAFRRRGEAWERRQEAREESRNAEQELVNLGGVGERLGVLKERLSHTDKVEQEERQCRAAGQVRDLRLDLSEKVERLGGLRGELGRVETEGSAAELYRHEEALLARLREVARIWSVYALARAVVGEARERYERERQPGVVSDAGRFFRGITGGRYERILAVPGETTLEVVDGHGARKRAERLSRGAQEQLYLALRLGLIREFGRQQEPLPVVMDDVFVNFDPGRAAAAVEAVLELARSHQVLLFTCHPETVELVRAAEPAVRLYDLARLTRAR